MRNGAFQSGSLARLSGALPRVCGTLTMAIGAIVLLGWMIDPEWLRRSSILHLPMNPVTALCITLCGLAVIIARPDRPRPAQVLGGIVALIALAKLIDVATGALPIDRIFFAGLLDGPPGAIPSRFAPNAALSLFLGGISLALAGSRRLPARVTSQGLAIGMLLLAMMTLFSYFFALEVLSPMTFYVVMKPATVIGVTLIAIALLAMTSDRGMIALLRDKGPAGAISRLILPVTLAAPAITGLLRLWGERSGFYSLQTAAALQVTVHAALTLVLLMASVVALERSDRLRREREDALRRSEQLNRLIAAANPDPICLLDENAIVGFANEAVVRLSGIPRSDLIGLTWGYMFDEATMAERDKALAIARVGGTGRMLIAGPAPDGSVRWYDTLFSALPTDHDWPYRFLVGARDVTEKRNSEERDQWSATHDALTELPNRAFFQDRLDERIAGEDPGGFAVLLVDIDNFKLVNDTLGHDAGDALLRSVARRICHAVREGDIVSRVAGDEFAVLLSDVRNEQGALAIADRIVESFRDPWVHKGRMADCRISIGVAIAPRHGRSGSELLKNVDLALYDAKRRGKAQIAVFRSGMKAAMHRQSRQIELAREALRSDLIVPYYQPKVALASGKVAGFEALLRWRHPHRGVQLPATIAAAFEDMDLASEITERMLTHVIEDMVRWIEQGVAFDHVAINLTAADLRQSDFADRLLARLDASGIPHRFLQVEVTETVFLGRGAEYVERALKQLNGNGIRVALDDFGTGYASLSHLKQFPVDIVKIDRSFLQDIERNAHNDVIINTVISLGHSLNIEIVAEGIETYEQERRLTARGCTYGQGFYFGKAAPAARVPRIIAAPARREPKVA